MKKSSKIGLGVGGAMCVAGLVLFGVGISSGGGEYVIASDINDMNGRIQEQKVFTMKKTKLEDIHTAEIDLEELKLTIKPSEDENYYLEYQAKAKKGKNPLEYTVENGVLNVTETIEEKFYLISIDLSFLNEWIGNPQKESREEVVLYVPSNKKLDYFSAEMGEYDFYAEGLNCKEADIRVEYGDFVIKNSVLDRGSIVVENGGMEADQIEWNETDVTLQYGSLFVNDSKWNDSTIKIEDGDLETNQLSCTQTDISLEYGGFVGKNISMKDSTVSLEDGGMTAEEIAIEGDVTIASEYGDVLLDVVPENLSGLSISCDTEYGGIEVGDLDGKISENEEEESMSYERKAEQEKGYLQVECEEGDIEIK